MESKTVMTFYVSYALTR